MAICKLNGIIKKYMIFCDLLETTDLRFILSCITEKSVIYLIFYYRN